MRKFWLRSHGPCSTWMRLLIFQVFWIILFCILLVMKIRVSIPMEIRWIIIFLVSRIIPAWLMMASTNNWTYSPMSSVCASTDISSTDTCTASATTTIRSYIKFFRELIMSILEYLQTLMFSLFVLVFIFTWSASWGWSPRKLLWHNSRKPKF